MDLWIRSQDKRNLVKVNALWIMEKQIWMEVPFYENCKKLGLTVTGHNQRLATYKSKERALEVLDDIQNKIQNQYLLKPKGNMKLDMIQDAKRYFENLNGIKIVTCDDFFEMSPTNSNVVVYELPEE